jgi:hypothetical protein
MAPTGLTYTLNTQGTLTATDQKGETVFTLAINATGEYTFTLLKPIPEVIASSPPFSSVQIDPGNPEQSLSTLLYQSYDPQTGLGIGDPVTSVIFSSGPPGHLLNPSRDGLGVDNNLIDDPVHEPSEVMTMSFADDLTGAAIYVGNLSNKDVLVWRVYNDGTLVDEGQIAGSYHTPDGSVVSISNSESPTYWIDLAANGLEDGAVFDRLELGAAKDTSYKFLAFTVEKPITLEDLPLQFGVNANDGDGDVSANAGFSVTIDASSNVQQDMAGDTVFAGGEGADVFKWTLAEAGARDTVTDFDLRSPSRGGDTLDLRDLLPSESSSGHDLSSYLHFESSASGTLVKISAAGQFNGNAEHDAGVAYQTIELHGVDLMSLGSDHQQILDTLRNNGKLITD